MVLGSLSKFLIIISNTPDIQAREARKQKRKSQLWGPVVPVTMLCAFPEVTETGGGSAGGDGRGEVSLTWEPRQGPQEEGTPRPECPGPASGQWGGAGLGRLRPQTSPQWSPSHPTAIMLLSALVETEGIVCEGCG